MSESKLFIPILLGTFRKDRESGKVAKWVRERAEASDVIETQFFDVRDVDLPQDDYGPDIKDVFPEWRDAIVKADGLIIVTPEYNRGYPGPLKSTLDLLLKEYIHKVVGIVSVSAGPWGGVRVVETLLPTLREMGLVTTFTDINFPHVAAKFDDEGNITDDHYVKFWKDFEDELVWMARCMKYGRENLPSKYHQK